METTNYHFKKIYYEKYKLDWMLSHGFSLTELIEKLNKNYNEFAGEESDYKPSYAMTDFEDTDGFGSGMLWAGFDEFMETEYKDASYMHELLARYPAPFVTKEEAIEFYEKTMTKKT